MLAALLNDNIDVARNPQLLESITPPTQSVAMSLQLVQMVLADDELPLGRLLEFSLHFFSRMADFAVEPLLLPNRYPYTVPTSRAL